MKGQCQVKLGQKSQIFNFKICLQSHCHPVQFVSGFQKTSFTLIYGNKECKKKYFKVTSSRLPIYCHCTAKTKNVLNFGMRVTCR